MYQSDANHPLLQRFGGTDPFIDPYSGDFASLSKPKQHTNALKWAERVVLNDGMLFSAIWRIVSYFITDIEIEGDDLSQAEKDDHKEFFIDGLAILPTLQQIGVDYLVYGNSFPTFVVPFTRHLLCQNCRNFEAPLSRVASNPYHNFSWSKFEFKAVCPRCGVRGAWKRIDRPSDRREDIRVVVRSPHEINIVCDPYTGQSRYFWQLPEYYKHQLTERPRRQDEVLPTYQLERAPWSVLQSIRDQQHVLFDSNYIFHVKDRPLSGIVNHGWGIPRSLITSGQTFHVQTLRRMNNTLALDYAIPMRLISPAAGAKAGVESDPMLNSNLGGMNASLSAMIEHSRRDKTGWHFFPFPVQYQLLGGEANNLVSPQLLESATRDALNGMGCPEDFHRGTLTMQTTLTAARLFTSYHSNLLYYLNGVLSWLSDRMSESQGWDRFRAKLPRPTHFDDMNRQLTTLQLASQGQMSQTDSLKGIGFDFRDQQKKILDEQAFIAELKKEVEQDMADTDVGDAMAGLTGGGGAPAGAPGMPAPGGAPPADPNMPQPVDPATQVLSMLPTSELEQLSPSEIDARAAAVADSLFTLPEPIKDSLLIKIKKISPTIHARAKEILGEKRREAALNGQVLMQQQAQQGAAPPPM